MSTEHGVAIVVDRGFGDRLIALARRLHVWIIDSPVNRPAYGEVWRAAPGYVLESGATIFNDDGTQPPDAVAARILDVVEQHHGVDAHTPPLSRLEIYGASRTPLLRAALEDLRFDKFESIPAGFLAVRTNEGKQAG
jgi:hypothetical protein